MSVAQGATWSDTIGPIIDSGGTVVSNAVSAGQLTITALYDPNGTDQKTGCTLTYLGNGVYQVSKAIASNAALGNWTLIATWNNTLEPTRTYVGSFEVVTAQQADPAASLRVGNAVFTTAPIALNGTITLYKRNDYAAAETRSLDWSTTDAGTWPDLTGATIAFASIPTGGALADGLRATGSVITPTGTTKHVRVELTALQSRTAKSGGHGYQLRATLTNGDVVTLAAGNLKVLEYIG